MDLTATVLGTSKDKTGTTPVIKVITAPKATITLTRAAVTVPARVMEIKPKPETPVTGNRVGTTMGNTVSSRAGGAISR